MRLIQAIILLFGLISSPLSAQTLQREEIQWISFEALTDSLIKQPKPVLIFMHTDWCVFCKKMMKETFSDAKVIKKINLDYYAVSLDAETVEEIKFDGFIYRNSVPHKKTGTYHALATILIGENKKPIFPVTMLLDKDFRVVEQKFNYLSIRQMLKIL